MGYVTAVSVTVILTLHGGFNTVIMPPYVELPILGRHPIQFRKRYSYILKTPEKLILEIRLIVRRY